jgi:hypothetical protein
MILVKHYSMLYSSSSEKPNNHFGGSYAISELQKDVDSELSSVPESEREMWRAQTTFGVFVVHDKNKPKLAALPPDTP